MKKVFLFAALFMLLCGISFAQDVVQPVPESKSLSLTDVLHKVPDLKQGMMYNYQDSKLTYISTIKIMNWKNLNLEVGYSTPNAIIAVISYPVLKLRDLGVNVPILDLVEFNIGYGVGFDRFNFAGGGREFVHGVTATLISIKF